MRVRYPLTILSLTLLAIAVVPSSRTLGQSDEAARPIVGLRDQRPRLYALQHAELTVEPGRTISDATVLVDGSAIAAVGTDIQIPAGVKTIDCTGKRVYAGLIDAWSEIEVPITASETGYWNPNVAPSRSAATVAAHSNDADGKLRAQGITARLVAPRGGIVKGTSCVVLLGGSSGGERLLKEHAWQHLQLTVPRLRLNYPDRLERYPRSPMGAVALLRQSLHDATWYRDAWAAYRANPTLDRPETNVALEELARAISADTFVIDAQNERMAIRAIAIADEFSLPAIVRGSGREYQRLDEIAAANRPILLPVNFPTAPAIATPEIEQSTTLRDLMHWDLAPENPARLADAGVSICLTTDGLEDAGKFLAQVRRAVQRGLSADAALAALTTVPAELLEINEVAGRVQPGMLANLIVTDSDLFGDKTRVLETWIAGERFVIDSNQSEQERLLPGSWQLELRAGDSDVRLDLDVSEKGGKYSATIAADDDDESDSVKLQAVKVQRNRLDGTIDLHAVDEQLPTGVSRVSLIAVADREDGLSAFAAVRLPDGSVMPSAARKLHSAARKLDSSADEDPDESSTDSNDDSKGGDETGDNSTQDSEPAASDRPEIASSDNASSPTPLFYPLGAYGRTQPGSDPEFVLFRGATVWTCDEQGTLETADVLIQDGLIAAIGERLPVPTGCRVIDATGKHISPGLIDCHSHMATDGGVNESGQAVSAEVRIGDFIDNTDISIYRQLAGGLTTSNILHGSANPIGGQNQVIKLRWGESMDGLRMKEAPAGIKFALGENVKRSTTRYPNTRMGVEQMLRDQLLAAREYQSRWRRWRAGQRDGLPPRFDLQMEALAEVQRGERWIHCHSYRQDEIVATLDVLDEFGIQIGTLQHILEGYKVADRMAEHGAMGSSFSDWWAYKFEVIDAIPYNGALMHQQGIVVSFNSDDSELARRLNTEAAKATKYGAVSEQEALKFVTLNPAKQLRIDQYVGSLAVGKHADLVVWSGRPLSTLSRCEQTWIDGRPYFDRELDQQLRDRDSELRAKLVQKVLGAGAEPKQAKEDKVEEEERWLRHDEFCGAHGGAEFDRRGRIQ